jgi:ketosteroid isomerase-like protein
LPPAHDVLGGDYSEGAQNRFAEDFEWPCHCTSYFGKLAAEKGAESQMNANETAVRNAYQVAERKDFAGWVNLFTEDGTFTDESLGVTYRGKELSRPVEVYAAAFPDMHRELYRFFVDGDTVIVELALQGTQKGPLQLPMATIQPTGKRMDAPCCDVFRLKNGKIQSFDCYPSGTVILTQLGVLRISK